MVPCHYSRPAARTARTRDAPRMKPGRAKRPAALVVRVPSTVDPKTCRA